MSEELQGYYQDLGLAVSNTVDLVKGLIQQLADEAITVEIELAAGALPAETGVGLVAMYALAALEIAAMIKAWGRINEAYVAADQALRVVTAAAGAAIGRIGVALQSFPQPGSRYDNPAV